MPKKKIHKAEQESAKIRSTNELQDLPLEKMDFDVVKKILSDYLAEEITIEDETEVAEDERFLVLEVQSLEEGLHKAAELLDLSIKELKYRKLESIFKNIDGESVEYQKYEFKRKIVSGKPILRVAEDKLSASFKYIYPRTLEGKEVDRKFILDMLKNARICHGIMDEAIEKLLRKLQENFDVLQDILIARGVAPAKGGDSRIIESCFPEIRDIAYGETRQRFLGELLNSSLETIRHTYFPVRVVQKHELIASLTLPEAGKDGTDIFGVRIPAGKGSIPFNAGKNVSTNVEGNTINLYSDIFGYLEFEGGELQVHYPVRISEDLMEAYFIGLPSIDKKSKHIECDDILNHLRQKGVVYGIRDSAVLNTIRFIGSENYDFFIETVALGSREEKGAKARIELFFEREKQVGKVLEGDKIDYREIDAVKNVQNKQLIAVKHLPQLGKPGRNLKGEEIPAPMGDDIKFNPLNNVTTTARGDKILYYATIEGRVVMVGDSGISVNQAFEIRGNVDFNTGNIEFSGDVTVKGSVNPGFKIKADGNIFIGGMVNQGVDLIAGGNIMMKQGVIGKDLDTKIKAKGTVFAQYLQSVFIEAESDVIVVDYIRNSVIRTKGKVLTPDKELSMNARGSIMGGEVMAIKGIVANSIGSDYAKNTKITAGLDYEFDTKFRNFQAGIDFCDREISKLSKAMRLGMQDIAVLKERIRKLPEDKQKAFVTAFKKVNELGELRQEITRKRDMMIKQGDQLSQDAEIIIKKELYPRVNIQIGGGKLRTEKLLSAVRLKESANRKEIEIGKFSSLYAVHSAGAKEE